MKISVTKETVNHVAELSRLGLSPSELEHFQSELSTIIDYVSELDKTETENVVATSQVTGLENALDEDVVVQSLDPKLVVSQAPKSERGFIKVKNILI